MLKFRKQLLALAGVFATVGLYAMKAPAWLWFATAFDVVLIAVLLGAWRKRWVQVVIGVCLAANAILVSRELLKPARSRIEVVGA